MDWASFDRLLASRRRSIVQSFVDCLRLESVSQEPEKVRATGEWLAAAMRARGLDGRVMETGGNPAVFGERRVPGATRTVLIYCHYDTKPIPLAGWLQPNPLEPVFRRGLAEDNAPVVPWEEIAEHELGIASTDAAPPTTRVRSGAISTRSRPWTPSASHRA
jgi:acetylornithine deacetylase/succinyl-diaminopimelate desuccinylase-like protein